MILKNDFSSNLEDLKDSTFASLSEEQAKLFYSIVSGLNNLLSSEVPIAEREGVLSPWGKVGGGYFYTRGHDGFTLYESGGVICIDAGKVKFYFGDTSIVKYMKGVVYYTFSRGEMKGYAIGLRSMVGDAVPWMSKPVLRDIGKEVYSILKELNSKIPISIKEIWVPPYREGVENFLYGSDIAEAKTEKGSYCVFLGGHSMYLKNLMS